MRIGGQISGWGSLVGVEHFMNDIDERLKKAKILLESGLGEEGRTLLLEVLGENPENLTAMLMLAGAYFYEKKYACWYRA